MVLGQGNFHIKENDLKFIITWEIHLFADYATCQKNANYAS